MFSSHSCWNRGPRKSTAAFFFPLCARENAPSSGSFGEIFQSNNICRPTEAIVLAFGFLSRLGLHMYNQGH